MRSNRPILVLCLLTALTGCAGGNLTPPSLPSLGAPVDLARANGSPTEVYTRIAHGAVTCWFGATGTLKGTHLFYADAEPQDKGGTAEIAIHEREAALPKPWGRKVFRIALAPTPDERTAISVENIKLPDPLVAQMKADVFAWASEKQSCTAGEGGTGFYKPPPEPAPVAAKVRKKPAPALRPTAQ